MLSLFDRQQERAEAAHISTNSFECRAVQLLQYQGSVVSLFPCDSPLEPVPQEPQSHPCTVPLSTNFQLSSGMQLKQKTYCIHQTRTTLKQPCANGMFSLIRLYNTWKALHPKTPITSACVAVMPEWSTRPRRVTSDTYVQRDLPVTVNATSMPRSTSAYRCP